MRKIFKNFALLNDLISIIFNQQKQQHKPIQRQNGQLFLSNTAYLDRTPLDLLENLKFKQNGGGSTVASSFISLHTEAGCH